MEKDKKCKLCKNNSLQYIVEDEGGARYYWCFKCGCMAIGIDGPLEYKPLGKSWSWN